MRFVGLQGYLLAFILLPAAVLGRSLTLKEIFDVATQQIESVAIQKNQVKIAREKLVQVQSNFYPRLSFLLSYTRQDTPTLDNDPNRTISRLYDPNQAVSRINASLIGIQGFREVAAYKGAKLDIQAQEQALGQVKLMLYTEVAQAYYNVLAARRDLTHAQSLAKYSGQRVAEIRRFVGLGRSREGDLLAQETQTTLLESEVRNAQEVLKIAEDTLHVIAGLEQDDFAADDLSELPAELPPVETFLETIDTRPDMKSLQAQIASAKQTVVIVRSQHFPTLDLTANVYPWRTGLLASSHWDVGFTFNLPLFQGFAVVSEERAARLAVQSTQYALEATRRSAEKDIRTAYDSLKGSIETILVLKKAVKVANRAYDLQLRDYRTQLVSNLDVNQALIQLYDTKRIYDKSAYSGKTALESLNAATGKIP